MTAHAKIETENDLEKLISDYGPSKYQDIVRAMQWARHLRRQEDFRNIPMAELIDRSLFDVVSGKVKVPEIEAAVTADQEIEAKLATKRSDEPRKPRKEAKEDKPAKDAA
ncbi:MAG: hypothetical protein A2X35_06010 [Elusimicrobia bacterium GWA2_61_42]|nr:MAG: hypothetical protein A2X35_06010 [Elusimicrobia bacterium GWA2_61_42]OGR80319.1 MAG: hypothetical protein A2X38_01035 [Elusimicrobia bacterium GWC2_61_25]